MDAASTQYLTTAEPLETWWDDHIIEVEEGSDEATQHVPLTTPQFHARQAKDFRDHGTTVKVDELQIAHPSPPEDLLANVSDALAELTGAQGAPPRRNFPTVGSSGSTARAWPFKRTIKTEPARWHCSLSAKAKTKTWTMGASFAVSDNAAVNAIKTTNSSDRFSPAR